MITIGELLQSPITREHITAGQDLDLEMHLPLVLHFLMVSITSTEAASA